MYVVRVLDPGVKNSCELSCGTWELNPDFLEGQSVLVTAQPSLQPQRLSNF